MIIVLSVDDKECILSISFIDFTQLIIWKPSKQVCSLISLTLHFQDYPIEEALIYRLPYEWNEGIIREFFCYITSDNMKSVQLFKV